MFCAVWLFLFLLANHSTNEEWNLRRLSHQLRGSPEESPIDVKQWSAAAVRKYRSSAGLTNILVHDHEPLYVPDTEIWNAGGFELADTCVFSFLLWHLLVSSFWKSFWKLSSEFFEVVSIASCLLRIEEVHRSWFEKRLANELGPSLFEGTCYDVVD